MSNQSFELQVREKHAGSLATNARELLAMIREKLKDYTSEKYSEENIAEAKADKAMLNKLADGVNKQRIGLEREFMAPLEEFKQIANQIVSEVKSGSDLINQIVKDVEDREKQKKKSALEEYYSEFKVSKIISFDRIFVSSWLNKGTTVEKAKANIYAAVDKIDEDLSILERLGEPEAKSFYLDTLDISAAMKEADRIKENRARLEAIEKQKNEQKQEVHQEIQEPKQDELFEMPTEKVKESEKTWTRLVEITGNKFQLDALANYLTNSGIAYRSVIVVDGKVVDRG